MKSERRRNDLRKGSQYGLAWCDLSANTSNGMVTAMGRKTSNSLPPAQQMRKGVPYLPIYYGLMDSPAYKALSGTCTRLLVFACRRDIAARLHAQRDGKHDPLTYPTDKWELIQGQHKGKGLFFLNLALVRAEGLYKASKQGGANRRGAGERKKSPEPPLRNDETTYAVSRIEPKQARSGKHRRTGESE